MSARPARGRTAVLQTMPFTAAGPSTLAQLLTCGSPLLPPPLPNHPPAGQDMERLLSVYQESAKSHPSQADKLLIRHQRYSMMLRLLTVRMRLAPRAPEEVVVVASQ